MNARSAKWLIGVSLLALTAPPAAAETESDRRAARARPRTAAVREPARIESLPARLVLTADSGPAARTRPTADPPAPGTESAIARQARRAARWAAREQIEELGRRQYYRVGFHAALRAALADPALGRWALVQGERDGWRDPAAREEGYRRGEVEAAEAARQQAERRVAEQFRDLAATPRFRPRPGLPRYDPEPSRHQPPGLREVFSEFPWAAFPPLEPARAGYLSPWSYDAWRLYRCDHYHEFYDVSWSDPDHALRMWLGRPRRAASYRHLTSDEERARFREAFRAEFRRSLARMFERSLRPAYELGFTDGWSYGAFIREEWEWRRGFHKGFHEASTAAAAHAFERSYPGSYESAYRSAFREWSDNPCPEIRDVAIHDGDGDGIFEPGERVFVEYELVNYGGAAGRFELALDGGVLGAAGRASVELAARDVLRQRDRLSARIGERVPARTRTSLRFSIADQIREVPILVSRPLEFAGPGFRTRRRDLDGEVLVEVAVRNRSRRSRGAAVILRTAALPGFETRRELDSVAATGAAAVTFELSGLEPLDLISGAVTLELELHSGAVLQDRFAQHLSGTARDLRSRDLIDLLVRMSRDAGTTGAELVAAREQLMLRLEADWTAAVRARGNPYKKDLKTRGSRTALGELVQTYRREQGGFTRPDVFGGLSSEILMLARELPGPHPLLRKYARRLARQLP